MTGEKIALVSIFSLAVLIGLGASNLSFFTENPTDATPTKEKPIDEEPTKEIPFIEEPSIEVPSIEVPSIEEPSNKIPSIEEPSNEEPSNEEPSNEEPSNEEPSNEVPETTLTTNGNYDIGKISLIGGVIALACILYPATMPAAIGTAVLTSVTDPPISAYAADMFHNITPTNKEGVKYNFRGEPIPTIAYDHLTFAPTIETTGVHKKQAIKDHYMLAPATEPFPTDHLTFAPTIETTGVHKKQAIKDHCMLAPATEPFPALKQTRSHKHPIIHYNTTAMSDYPGRVGLFDTGASNKYLSPPNFLPNYIINGTRKLSPIGPGKNQTRSHKHPIIHYNTTAMSEYPGRVGLFDTGASNKYLSPPNFLPNYIINGTRKLSPVGPGKNQTRSHKNNTTDLSDYPGKELIGEPPEAINASAQAGESVDVAKNTSDTDENTGYQSGYKTFFKYFLGTLTGLGLLTTLNKDSADKKARQDAAARHDAAAARHDAAAARRDAVVDAAARQDAVVDAAAEQISDAADEKARIADALKKRMDVVSFLQNEQQEKNILIKQSREAETALSKEKLDAAISTFDAIPDSEIIQMFDAEFPHKKPDYYSVINVPMMRTRYAILSTIEGDDVPDKLPPLTRYVRVDSFPRSHSLYQGLDPVVRKVGVAGRERSIPSHSLFQDLDPVVRKVGVAGRKSSIPAHSLHQDLDPVVRKVGVAGRKSSIPAHSLHQDM